MIKNTLISPQKWIIFLAAVIAFIACEKDFENIGTSIVDDHLFESKQEIINLITYSKNIERTQTNNLSYYQLGVQRDAGEVFGKLQSSFVTQLSLLETEPDYGDAPVIDSVLVEIPYLYTQEDDDDNGKPQFTIDSLWQNGNGKFMLNVYELGTYLHSVDPDDPTVEKKYYSNDDELFIKSDLLFSDLFVPNANDTMSVINRYKYPLYPDLTQKEIYQKDTIKEESVIPSLKIPLDKNVFKEKFLDNQGATYFASNANFKNFFRGLYFEAIENTPNDESLFFLNFDDAEVTIYYSNDEIEDEGEEEDLNGNGITGEEDVTVRNPETLKLYFSDINVNLFDREQTSADIQANIDNSDMVNGNEQIFVQGTTGAQGVIKLFGEDADNNGVPDKLEMIRENNWLITEANIHLYIEENDATIPIPERLYLYLIDEEQNEQILDVLPNISFGNLGGYLVRDDDDQPLKYVFQITDYIRELCKTNGDVDLKDLGIKVYDAKDAVNTTTYDEKFDNVDTNPKGVVLRGNMPSTDNNRAKLEIYYTELNP